MKRVKCKWWMIVVGGAVLIGVVTVVILVLGKWFAAEGESAVDQAELVEEAEDGGEEESENATEVKETIEPEEEVTIEVDNAMATLGNCTTGWGNLMLINPNFTVGTDFIEMRRQGLISVSQNYGIPEYNYAGNGDNVMMPEAAQHLGEMVAAYKAYNPGHEMGTYSCFRARGTSCGRLCLATGTSDHHTGLTCDLIDLAYGVDLDYDDYANHIEWQWLKENSYKYGFIDRFPAAWAGGSMSEPMNVDGNGTTGLYETWHYRYVGVQVATEIAMGKYNNGSYDSLEHYLKATGRVVDLLNGVCAR